MWYDGKIKYFIVKMCTQIHSYVYILICIKQGSLIVIGELLDKLYMDEYTRGKLI